jgi:hypothetical protein
MPTALVPEILKRSLGPIRELIEDRPPGPPPELVRQASVACEIVSLNWERHAGDTAEVIEEGIEGSKLRFVMKESLDAIQLSLWVFGKVRELAHLRLPPGRAQWHALERLSGAVDRMEKVKQEYEALLHFAEGEAPTVNPGDLLDSGTEGQTAGGYEGLDSILARLQTGHDV